MGVDFYHCASCEESRYEEYVGWCQGCSKGLCTACVVNDDVKSDYAYQYGYKFDSGNPELMKKYEAEGYSLYRENGESYYEDGDVLDDSSISSNYCPFCTGVEVNRDEVLDYLLSKYDLKIEDVWKELRK